MNNYNNGLINKIYNYNKYIKVHEMDLIYKNLNKNVIIFRI